MKIGYGTYGMPKLAVTQALEASAGIGYDGVELCCLPNAPAHPSRLDAAARRDIRDRLASLGLELPALMLGLDALAADPAGPLAALREAGQLALDLAPDRPPVLVTTTGGSPPRWDECREQLVEVLGQWARVAGEMGLVLAVEPHVGGVLCRPEQAEWVRARVGLDSLKFNYDESHFQLRGLDLAESAKIMIPHAVATHQKDARGDADHVQFLLPGEGDFAYPGFVRLLAGLGYDGYLTVEVSGMVWGREDYDPLAAARFSYATLSDAVRAAGVARG